MRKLLAALLLLFVYSTLNAQSVFYGLTKGNGEGTISKFDASNNNLTAAYTFKNSVRSPYNSEFVQGVNGKLYGTTSQGGVLNKGVIFSFDPTSNIHTKFQDLSSNCTGVLTKGNGSMIYGLTADYIFKFNTGTGSYTVLHNFSLENKFPLDGLTLGADGKFYGITESLIFSYDTVSNTYTKLLDLDPAMGGPVSGMTLGPDNKFYYPTIGGDLNYQGSLYSFNPSTLMIEEVHIFNSYTGDFPLERLTLANNGKLYGVTSGGLHLGVIYSYEPVTDTYTHLHDFENGTGGRYTKPLTQGSDGKLYGGSSSVVYNDGIIFSFDHTTNTFTKLHDIQPNTIDGEMPTGMLLQASNGKFYGMLANEYGTPGKIFSFDHTTNTFSALVVFQEQVGYQPNGSLVQGPNGLFYGTTNSGGLYDRGVLFSFNPANDTYTKLHDFDNWYNNGYRTSTVLTLLSNGKFYGTTSEGGASGLGIIFTFEPSSGTFTKIYDFNSTDGRGGFGLTEGNNGLLYSVSELANGQINIYSLNPITFAHTNHFTLNNIYPVGNFVKTPVGRLYAMGRGGFYGYGVIYSFDPQTNTGSEGFSFDQVKGRAPFGDLFFSQTGAIYGMTSQGGANNAGVLFSINGLTVDKLFDFGGANGATPLGGILEANGRIYGMTSSGGEHNLGVVFSYRPSTGTFTKLQDFNGSNGANPQNGSLAKLISPNTKHVKVNIYGGSNPYNNPEWNNWNVFASLSSNLLHYSDGSMSTITATLSQQTSVSDNGPTYFTSIAPQEVTRYASYSTSSRTLTISGLENKAYLLELYATRAGASNNTTRFMINNRVIDIMTANNLTVKASYNALGGYTGSMTLNISSLNTYNYINGFILTEIRDTIFNPPPIVDAGTDKSITLPVNSVQMNGTATDENGFISSYNWTKISGPTQYNISNTSDPAAIISNLVQGIYIFRLTSFDNQGANSFDEVEIVVHASGAVTKYVKVNFYGGVNPYNHTEWNNWNSSASLSSGNLKYSDGVTSSINASINQQSGVSDNGVPYNSTMAPPEVVRYASYSNSNRTLTLTGLDNSKTYNLEIYASRKGVSNNTSRFTIGTTSVDIVTDNNLSNKASFVSLTPSGGQITISISKLNTYNYINGFILTENGTSAPSSMEAPVTSILKEDKKSSLTGIYPNPVRNNLMLQLKNNYIGQMKVQVLNVNGVMVKEFRLNKNNKGEMQANLPVGELMQGQYFIRIQMGNNFETKKISKF